MATDNSAITVTDAAAKRVFELIEIDGNHNLRLRIYITGGGCSGFQYAFKFDHGLQENDQIFSKDKIQVVIDVMSFMYLNGATLDYVETLQGAHFSVKNPNAQSTCSCGSSFAI